MKGIHRGNQSTNVAEFAFESAAADALAAGALAVPVTIGDLALVVFQAALAALPARIALALAIDVVTSSATEDRADA